MVPIDTLGVRESFFLLLGVHEAKKLSATVVGGQLCPSYETENCFYNINHPILELLYVYIDSFSL